jgi:hypothetical protein
MKYRYRLGLQIVNFALASGLAFQGNNVWIKLCGLALLYFASFALAKTIIQIAGKDTPNE